MVSGDLLNHEYVTSDVDYVGWYPVDSNTRGQAVQRFTRSMQNAGWSMGFTDVRVVKRCLHLHPERHPSEGLFVECNDWEYGATPVWRCELRGSSPWVRGGKLAD